MRLSGVANVMLAWVRVVRISATMYEHVQGGPSNLHDTTHASPSSLAAAALHEADMLTLTPLRGGHSGCE